MTTCAKHSRFWAEKSSDPSERAEFGKDYDRVLYSSAFRRLHGVTQVESTEDTSLYHNRLTHSLKVAQVGVRLHQQLEKQIAKDGIQSAVDAAGGLDSRVVRAACMAHDLGHPPFSHISETAFQQILCDEPDVSRAGNPVYPLLGTADRYSLPDSFEGNAQTFRVLTKLAFREPDFDSPDICRALNLTAGTLCAVLKYPWMLESAAGPNGKWGYYESEADIQEWAKNYYQNAGRGEEPRSVEAQVMDWADDISYAVHDVEDFFRTGVIPLDLLQTSDDELEKVLDYSWGKVSNASENAVSIVEFRNYLDNLRQEIFPARPFTGSRSNREQMHSFASKLITSALAGTSIDGAAVPRPSSMQRAIIEFFKQLTWYYVIDRPSLGSSRRGHVVLIRELFRDLTSWVQDDWTGATLEASGRSERQEQGLPVKLVDYLGVAFSADSTTGCSRYSEAQKVSRAVVDYISSLTERQALGLNNRLSGNASVATSDLWL